MKIKVFLPESKSKHIVIKYINIKYYKVKNKIYSARNEIMQ